MSSPVSSGKSATIFCYALAQGLGELLLFKGEDFPRTDVVRCPSR